MSVADPIAGHAASQPDGAAIICNDIVCTYAELDDNANRLARVLASRHVARDERVAVMLPNSIEWFEATVAIARLGAQLVPVNWHLKPDELAWILSDSDARVLRARACDRLALKSRHPFRLQTQVRVQNLERDAAWQRELLGFPDDAHAAAAELLDEPEVTEPTPDPQR